MYFLLSFLFKNLMKLTKISGSIIKVLSVAAAFPVVAMAQIAPPAAVVTTYGGVIDIIKNATAWLFGILLVAAVVFLIYAAFLYLTSGGEEEKTKKAKSYVIYAVIAIGIGILAQAIVALVGSFLNYNIPTQ